MNWGKDYHLYCDYFPDDIYWDFQRMTPLLKKLCGKYYIFTEKWSKNSRKRYIHVNSSLDLKVEIQKRYNTPNPTFPIEFTKYGDEKNIYWSISHAKVYVMNRVPSHGSGGTDAIWFIPKTEREVFDFINVNKPEFIKKFDDRKQVIKKILPEL
jgi:hypothetical protein